MIVGFYSDLHFGIYHDDDDILQYQLSQLNKINNELLSKGISHVIILGDVFDSRKNLNIKTVEFVKDFFKSQKITFHIITGNHDYYNKDDNNYSSVRTIFDDVSNVNVIEGVKQFLDTKLVLCSWVFQDDLFLHEIKQFKDFKYVFGHFEMKDFYYLKNIISKNGFDRKLFKNFKNVFSGHYHIYQEKDNITYIGTPYQIDWNDHNVKKYYHTLDLDTGEVNKYENNDDLFIIINSNDNIDGLLLNNKIVRFIITEQGDHSTIIELIKKQNPMKLSISDNVNIIKQNQENIELEAELLDVSKEYIEKNIIDDTIDKDRLFEYFGEIYTEVRGV